METSTYRGLWTALVTPFKKGNGIDNDIDYKALEALLDMQVKWWVTWILLLGTTAENPTLTSKESKKIVKFAIKKLKWKCKVMVNIWTYSTLKSLENVKKFDKIKWIDAYLVVNPYYNKPTQTGLYEHFTTIANKTERLVVLYNIKGRTGVNLETETLVKIAEKCSNVIWVKEASWDLKQMEKVIKSTKEDFLVLSWDDWLTYDLSQIWWDWVISVASNCIPKKMTKFVKECLEKTEKAKELKKYYEEFFSKLFIQTNPLPAKTFLAEKWIIKEAFRLPMCKMDKTEKDKFLGVVGKYEF